MDTRSPADRAGYRQRLQKMDARNLVELLIGTVLANGFGQLTQDVDDVRAELIGRLDGGDTVLDRPERLIAHNQALQEQMRREHGDGVVASLEAQNDHYRDQPRSMRAEP